MGPPATRRQLKGVHKTGKQLQWPQLRENVLAGTPGTLVEGCCKEGQQ